MCIEQYKKRLVTEVQNKTSQKGTCINIHVDIFAIISVIMVIDLLWMKEWIYELTNNELIMKIDYE